jgi:hypothetical protein
MVKFTVRYVDQDGRRDPENRQPEQGVSLQVMGAVDGEDAELLRFDCFDREPHYHYAPQKNDERVLMDRTSIGNPIGWTIETLRGQLPEMLRRAGYEDVADATSTPAARRQIEECLAAVESAARETAIKWRRTVTHNGSAELEKIPGCEVIEAGNIRFGLEFRELPQINARGMAIHVLSDVAGREIELIAFDCFDRNAHYHYGPRNKDLRHYWDTTVVPDPLRWVLDRLAEGKLGSMIERAGYPSIAADLDTALIARLLTDEIEPKSLAIREANTTAS